MMPSVPEEEREGGRGEEGRNKKKEERGEGKLEEGRKRERKGKDRGTKGRKEKGKRKKDFSDYKKKSISLPSTSTHRQKVHAFF